MKQFFTVFGGWIILQLVHEILVLRRCSMKEVPWKTQNSQINTRSSHPEMFCQKKDVVRNFAKFTEKHFCRSLFFNRVAGWKPETFRSSHCRCSVKQGVLKKVTPTKVFPCELCELFQNTYFVEDLQTAGGCLFNEVASLTTWGSLIVLERDYSTGISLWIF